MLGGQEGGVAGDQADRDLGLRIIETPSDLADHVSHCQAQRHTAGGGQQELEAGVEQRERPLDRRHDGDAVRDQGGRVVDQALALDQVDDAAGGAQPAHDGGRRDRVRGRDDRPQGECHGPRQVEHQMPRHRHQHRRDQHEPNRRERQGAGISPQGVHLREERRDVQQRRQEDDQYQVGIELDLGQAGHEPQCQPTKDEDDRVRDADAAGNRVEDGHRHQDPGEDDVEAFHARKSGLGTDALDDGRRAPRDGADCLSHREALTAARARVASAPESEGAGRCGVAA